jgi:putative inorganic carbon (HCO3(-)) transporter
MSLNSSANGPHADAAFATGAPVAQVPRTLRGRRVAQVPRVTATSQLLALRFGDFWRAFAGQNLAFWAMCLYLVVEYVRPQQVYPALNDVPVGQFTLLFALAAHVLGGKWLELRSPGTWLLIAFTAVIVASSMTAFDSVASFREFERVWVTWVVIYLLIVSVVSTEERLFVFAGLWMAFHYYMSQGGVRQWAGRGFQFASWGITGQPGWFANSGEFAIAMCMFAAVSWHFYLAARPYLSKWRKVFVLGMPATAALGIIGSSSRGALLGLAALGLWTLLRTKRRVRTISALVVLGATVWVLLPPEQKARFTTVGEDDTSVSRLTYWKAGMDMARNNPTLGIGYGNWMTVYSRFYSQNSGGRSQVSHNIFVECVAELGFTGLLVFIALIICTLRINRQTRLIARSGNGPPNVFQVELAYGLDAAMITYLVAGFFVTVLYYPFFWINLALTVALNGIARKRAEGQDFQGHSSGTMRRGVPTRRGGMSGRVISGLSGGRVTPGPISS